MLDRIRGRLGASASVRRFVWRRVYQLLAGRYAALDLPFMNYGYDPDPGEPECALAAVDEPYRLHAQLYHRVVRPVDLRGLRVLEVGSGRGGGTAYLYRYHGPALTVGLDISERAAALSQTRHAAAGLVFVAGDAEALPFRDGTFDAVVNVESSHCYGSMSAFLGEVARVLRPEGYLLFADLRIGPSGDTLREELRRSGLHLRARAAITGAVLRSLAGDRAHRESLIDAQVPAPFRALARTFAGVPGSSVHDALREGRAEYLCCVLQKAPA